MIRIPFSPCSGYAVTNLLFYPCFWAFIGRRGLHIPAGMTVYTRTVQWERYIAYLRATYGGIGVRIVSADIRAAANPQWVWENT